MVADDVQGPNGLAFSPDELKLYVVESRAMPNRKLRVFDVRRRQALGASRMFIDAGPGTPDGFRVDIDGNLWCGWGMGEAELDGVRIFNPAGDRSAILRCRNAAPICASADAGAIACSWPQATASMHCT